MDIQTQLNDLFEQNIAGYIKWRSGNDPDRTWDEAYKWGVLKPFSIQLRQFKDVNLENIVSIIDLYQKNNPSEGAWVEYYFFARCKEAIGQEKVQELAKCINLIWDNKIDEAAALYKQITGHSISTSAVAYLLAAREPDKYPLYRGEFFTWMKADLDLSEPQSIESRYSLYRQIAVALGDKILTYLNDHEPNLYGYHKEFPALSGQDFLYYLYFGKDKLRMQDLIRKFVSDADSGTLKTKDYNVQYEKCRVKAGFGMGSQAQVPWIGFESKDKAVPKGISVNFLYYKDINQLVLAYGISEEHPPIHGWQNVSAQTISSHYAPDYIPPRYGTSLFYKSYDAHAIPPSIVEDLNDILTAYKAQKDPVVTDAKKKFWIFQGNPDVFDIEEYLSANEGKIIDWSANQSQDQMKKGDVVYFWSAKGGGMCGVGAITGKPADRFRGDVEAKFGNKKVDVKLFRFFNQQNRIMRSDLLNNRVLSNSKIIKQPQGSNFLLSEKEAFEIQKLMAKKLMTQVWVFTPGPNNEFLLDAKENNRIRIGWDRLGDLRAYVDRESIKNALQEHYEDAGSNQYNNTTACDEFLSKMQAGDIVLLKSGLTGITSIGHVTGDYDYDSSLEKFRSVRPAVFSYFGEWQYDPKAEPVFMDAAKNLPLKTMTDMSPYPELVERIINCMPLNDRKSMEDKIMPVNNISLNTILYGPPGTGKTYHALNGFAHDLLGQQAEQTKAAEEVLADRLKDLTWWQVTALSLYQINRPVKVAVLATNQIIVAYATYVKNRNTNIKPTLWAVLQERSDEDSSNTTYRVEGIEYFTKNNQSEWSLTESGKSLVEETLSDIDLVADAEVGSDWHKYLRTITFHQSYSYEEFIEGIRPVLNPAEQNGTIGFEIKDGVFKEMCSIARRDPGNKYLLIIDEINRGNISKVFGELITLLEDDKREALTVQLPYSKDQFTVPKNLFVLGTMNTADRSIALLDIALRRRFNFIEIMPDYKLIENSIDGVDLAALLKTVNQKLEVMTDRDHQIGHSYFMNVDDVQALHSVWYNKVLPLLSEYFYNDWDRLIEVVGVYQADKGIGFIHKKSLKDIQGLFGKETEYSEAVVGTFKNYSPQELPQTLKAIYEAEPQTD